MASEITTESQESRPVAPPSRSWHKNLWNWILRSQLVVLTGFLVLLLLVIGIIAPRFLDVYNLAVVTRQTSFVALVSLAQMMAMIGGVIDLSVGANAGFTGILAAWLMANTGLNPWICMLLGIVVGALIGAVNGVLVTRLKMNAFIATLSMSFILTGSILVVTQGWAIPEVPKDITWLGQGSVGPVPFPTLIALLAAGVLAFILNWTPFGRHIFAAGGNEEAARLVGVRVERVRTFLFIISGVLSSMAGVIMVARLASGQPTIGQTWLLPSFAAPILGGTAMSGGIGSVPGTLLGAVIMGVIQNGVVMGGLSVYLENVVIGSVLILAILLDSLRQRARQR